MKGLGKWAVVAVVILAVSFGLWKGGGWLLIRLPGLMNNPKVEPNRPVVWQAGPAVATTPVDQRQPNIILILADDLGFNDVSINGGGLADGAVPTPNIDAIGHGGVSFANGYAGNATCAPSRAALMTGRYPTRFGFEFTPIPKAMARFLPKFHQDPELGAGQPVRFLAKNAENVPEMADQVVPNSQITIASLLQHNGYHTVHFGKWHLGERPESIPDRVGFDESLGFSQGGSKYLADGDKSAVNSKQDFDPIDKFLWANMGYYVRYNGSRPFRPAEYLTDYLGKEAARSIHANRNRPFFMYLAFNAPHTPLTARREDYDALPQIKDHRTRVYGAMIRALDRNVGRVLDQLKADGLDQNTLVIFTSDNGGANYIGLPQINQPYRGWKMTFFEGGIHTPYFMRWPSRIPAGTRYDRPVSHFDIFATSAAASGTPMPTDRVMDGVDLVPYATGKASGDPHEALFWRSGDYESVRAGDWKLQVLKDPARTWLFDLKADPTERNNLAQSNPAKTAELKALLARHNAEQAKPGWPALVQGPVPVDRPLGVKGKSGEEFVYWDN